VNIKLGDVVAAIKGNSYGLMTVVHIVGEFADCVSFLDGEDKKYTISFDNLTKIDATDKRFLEITL